VLMTEELAAWHQTDNAMLFWADRPENAVIKTARLAAVGEKPFKAACARFTRRSILV
jgi:hypothetical protein